MSPTPHHLTVLTPPPPISPKVASLLDFRSSKKLFPSQCNSQGWLLFSFLPLRYLPAVSDGVEVKGPILLLLRFRRLLPLVPRVSPLLNIVLRPPRSLCGKKCVILPRLDITLGLLQSARNASAPPMSSTAPAHPSQLVLLLSPSVGPSLLHYYAYYNCHCDRRCYCLESSMLSPRPRLVVTQSPIPSPILATASLLTRARLPLPN